MKITGIYKITSPSGKIYIGQSIDIYKRFRGYFKKIPNTQVRLKRSVSKYGIYTHKFEIIEQCSVDQLNERERYWQDYYNVLNGGLNCVLTRTNDKLPLISKETRKNMSIAAKKRGISKEHRDILIKAAKDRIGTSWGRHTDETKDILREISTRLKLFKGKNNPMYGSKRFGKLNPFYGKYHTDETKEILRNNRIGTKHKKETILKFKKQRLRGGNSCAKIVLNTWTGIYYDCIKDASDSYSKIKYSTLKSKLNGNNTLGNNTPFVYA